MSIHTPFFIPFLSQMIDSHSQNSFYIPTSFPFLFLFFFLIKKMLELLGTTDESLAGAYFILKFEPIMDLFSEEIGEIIQFTR